MLDISSFIKYLYTLPGKFWLKMATMIFLIIGLSIILGIAPFEMLVRIEKFVSSIDESIAELSKKHVSDVTMIDYVTVPLKWGDFVNPNHRIGCEIGACSLGSKSYVPVGLLISGLYQAEFIYPCDSKMRTVFATSYEDNIHLSLGGPFNNFHKMDVRINFNCSEKLYSEFTIPFDVGLLLDKKISSISAIIYDHYLTHLKDTPDIIRLTAFLALSIFVCMIVVLLDIWEIFSKISDRHYE